jgi:hypothetical protein
MHSSVRRSVTLIATIAVIAAAAAIFPLLPLVSTPTGEALSTFGSLGSYLSGTLGAIASLATLAVALYATLLIPSAIEDQKNKQERLRQTVELSHKLFDPTFYVKVSAPAWEIAVKWLYWRCPEGDDYRRQVCGGMFLYAYPEFSSPTEANSAQYQNLLRFGHHFLPYDHMPANQPDGSAVIAEMSEHQVLTVWLQFWIHLWALLKAGLADEALAARLFAEWYKSWLRFMLELRFVAQQLGAAQTTDGLLRPGPEPDFRRFKQLEELEQILYQNSEEYLQAVSEAQERANEITHLVLELHNMAKRKATDA